MKYYWMRILPIKLKQQFSSSIKVYTVYDLNWQSLKNGELLKSLNEYNFDALITSDKNIVHQHNLPKYLFPFIIIRAFDNRYETLLPLVSIIESKLLFSGEQVEIVSTNS